VFRGARLSRLQRYIRYRDKTGARESTCEVLGVQPANAPCADQPNIQNGAAHRK
jgi:hypothetical protein